MVNRQKYNKAEGNYSRDMFSSKKTLFLIIGAVLFLSTFSVVYLKRGDLEENITDVRNQELYRMSVSDWEYIATNSKKRSDKEDALYLLFNTYEKRSIFNLYDFYLNHKGEMFTEEALAIVTLKSDSLYQEAMAINTEQGWSDYLVSVPEDFYRDAMDRYNDFRWSHTAELWDTEEKAWEQVELQKGTGAYERYLKLYPDGPHVSEARRTLKEYKREAEIRERNYERDKKRYQKWLEDINKKRRR